MEGFFTRRERILEVLRNSNRPLTVVEIAERLNIKDPKIVKEIYNDLKHVGKTLYRETGGRETLVMIPPQCLNCGYVFKDRSKVKRPSKCPRCRSERISQPSFMILRR
mgnify:CR=1 FL=1